jgi:hypothetical protein
MPNFRLAALLTLASCTALLAQKPSQPVVPVGRGVDIWVTRTEQLLIPAADALPEELYGFAPTAGEFAGVRTFAEQVKHLAAANYQMAALALGEQPPAGTANETAPATVRTKAQIMDYLRGSFASLHRAASLINPQNLEEPVVVEGSTEIRVGLMIYALAHAQNHYGQIVEYLRMNRIVPPASR